MQSDERLAELAGAGHESAFDAIVDRYRTPLTRYCAGIVGPSRAEDAVQQALINAHDALQRTDEVRNLRSWLYRIAHNAALNVLRAVRDDVPLDEATLHGAHGSASARVAAAASPAESFERSEEFRSTLAALQALPDRQRAALVLRELEGRSHEEIAAALGVTKGSARQHLMRARVAVRSAVTAITPYPLVVRLAEWASAGAGAGGASGWVEGAATAGAGASLAKLTAGLAATGALVGGAVGTQHVVRGGEGRAAAAQPSEQRPAERAVKRTSQTVVVPAAATPASAPSVAGTGPRKGERRATAPPWAAAKAKRHAARGRAPREGGAVAPAVAAAPSPSTSAPGDGEDSGSGGRSNADDHRSETGKQGSSHGRETSDSHRSGPAGHDKATKDEKRQGKKQDKSDPPGQAKKTAPAASGPGPAASEGSDGKGEGNGARSEGKGSDADDDTTAAATTTTESSTPATTTSSEDDDQQD